MTTEQYTETEKKNMETVRRLLHGFADGNVEQIDELVHKNFTNHNAPEGLQDRDGFRTIVERAHGAFSTFDTFKLNPVQLFAKDDHVAMMDVGEGSKDGRPYCHADIHLFVMKDGKMFEHWNSFGLPSQHDQLMTFLGAGK